MESGGKREKRLIIETLNRLTSHPRFLRIPGRLIIARGWSLGGEGGRLARLAGWDKHDK
jgi:hypothetical protein